MTDKTFRIQPQNSQCRDSLCLDDYERAWNLHQRLQFQRVNQLEPSLAVGNQNIGGDFEKFRSYVWKNQSYADGMKIQIRGPLGQMFSWSDVAANGRIEFSDIEGFMELGLVEFVAPSHRCLSSRVSPQSHVWPVRNRRDFQAMVKGMQELAPLHGEGMGNVFWSLCLPEAVESQPPPALPAPQPMSFAVDDADPCDGGDVDYYDDDLGQAVCEDSEPLFLSLSLQLGVGTLASASVGHGLGLAISAGAWEIGKIAAGDEDEDEDSF